MTGPTAHPPGPTQSTASDATWNTAFIGLGANLGETHQTLLRAIEALGQRADIRHVRLSPFYRSAPVQSHGPDYVNAVARLETRLTPYALLAVLQALETLFGRERPYRNAPRTLDLDVLLFSDLVQNDPVLTLPHPRMHERVFVLQPLKNLAPDMVLAQGSLDDLLAACSGQRICEMR